jgi:topoisomerase-4 subunit A
LTAYAINYLKDLLKKYGDMYPRRTEIDQFKKIDRRAVALNNIKVGWDRKDCYIGTNVKSDDVVTCNEFDHLLCVERKGGYKVINIPEKIFIGRLYDFRKYDPEIEFGVIYKEMKSGKHYAKRTVIDKFIIDRDYRICPKNCRLELLTPRSDSIYSIVEETNRGSKTIEVNLKDYPPRSPKARGLLITSKPVSKITHLRYLTDEELSIHEEGEPDSNDSPQNDENTIEVEPQKNTAEVLDSSNASVEENIKEAEIVAEAKQEPENVPADEKKEKSKPESVARKKEKTELEPAMDEKVEADKESKAPALVEDKKKEAQASDSEKASKAKGASKKKEKATQEKVEKSEKAAVSEKETAEPAAKEDKKTKKAEASKTSKKKAPKKEAEVEGKAEEIEKDETTKKESEPVVEENTTEEKTETPKTESKVKVENEPVVKADPKEESQDSDNDENEWGIIQPEFGF